MSAEKAASEAQRWLETADGDIRTAEVLVRSERWAHACFHAQQASEKALKGLWYAFSEEPWGHSVKRLIDDLAVKQPDLFVALAALGEKAARLDRYYVPTRYPNGLPELTPESAYFRADSEEAITCATEIIERAKELAARARR